MWSRPVSRVLFALRRDSHSSRRGVAAALKQPTREQRGQRYRSPIRSCSRWGLPCRLVAQLAVRSCRTVSPLPRIPPPLCRLAAYWIRTGVLRLRARRQVLCFATQGWRDRSAVCSLLHFPSARAAQALPGTLPCGARTFLDACATRLSGRLHLEL